MTFPAWFDFHKDAVIRRHPAAMVLYAHLVGVPESHWTPQPLKAWALADEFKFKKETIISAMNLLVKRGYLIEHARGTNNVRAFTVATTLGTSPPNPTAPNA